jgi:hypothetical protein
MSQIPANHYTAKLQVDATVANAKQIAESVNAKPSKHHLIKKILPQDH